MYLVCARSTIVILSVSQLISSVSDLCEFHIKTLKLNPTDVKMQFAYTGLTNLKDLPLDLDFFDIVFLFCDFVANARCLVASSFLKFIILEPDFCLSFSFH